MIIDTNFKHTVIEWLFIHFNKYTFISELHLIGSILYKRDINDVDVVQLINLEAKEDLKIFAKELRLIQFTFSNIFSINLHLTSFTKTEQISFVDFISKNNSIKII